MAAYFYDMYYRLQKRPGTRFLVFDENEIREGPLLCETFLSLILKERITIQARDRFDESEDMFREYNDELAEIRSFIRIYRGRLLVTINANDATMIGKLTDDIIKLRSLNVESVEGVTVFFWGDNESNEDDLELLNNGETVLEEIYGICNNINACVNREARSFPRRLELPDSITGVYGDSFKEIKNTIGDTPSLGKRPSGGEAPLAPKVPKKDGSASSGVVAPRKNGGTGYTTWTEEEGGNKVSKEPLNPATHLDSSMLTGMLKESKKTNIFFITKDLADRRHPINDIWLERWVNPCFCLDSPAINTFKGILDNVEQTNFNLTRRILFAGLLAMARNYKDRFDVNGCDQMNWIGKINDFIHCNSSGLDGPSLNADDATKKRNGSEKCICGQTIDRQHPLFHQIISKMAQCVLNDSARLRPTNKDYSVDDIAIDFRQFMSLEDPDLRNELYEKLFGRIPAFMELVIIHGFSVVLRWAFEMLRSNSLAETTRFFTEFGGGVIPTEIHRCQLTRRNYNMRSQHLIKYMGALIHCTENRPEQVLNRRSWTHYYKMIKRDMCDFMFTCMGCYTLNDDDESKYIRFLPERLTKEFLESHRELCKFSDEDGKDQVYINENLHYSGLVITKMENSEEDIPLSSKQQHHAARAFLNAGSTPYRSKFLLHDLDAIVDRLALICM
jgi:hypothetical protein